MLTCWSLLCQRLERLYKPANANIVANAGVHTTEENLNLSTTNKIPLKWDFISGSIGNGLRRSRFASFGFKVFCEPETIHYKETNKAVLITITFYLEDDNQKEVNFNGETLTFTLQMIKF